MPLNLVRKYTAEGRPHWTAEEPVPLEVYLSWKNEPPSEVKVWLRIKGHIDPARQINMPLFTIADGFQFMELVAIWEWVTDFADLLDKQVVQAVREALLDIANAGYRIREWLELDSFVNPNPTDNVLLEPKDNQDD